MDHYDGGVGIQTARGDPNTAEEAEELQEQGPGTRTSGET